jgi:hypothetical protein
LVRPLWWYKKLVNPNLYAKFIALWIFWPIIKNSTGIHGISCGEMWKHAVVTHSSCRGDVVVGEVTRRRNVAGSYCDTWWSFVDGMWSNPVVPHGTLGLVKVTKVKNSLRNYQREVRNYDIPENPMNSYPQVIQQGICITS